MKFNLASATKKKVLTPNPLPDRMLAVECEVAMNMWFAKALILEKKAGAFDGIKIDDMLQINNSLEKAAMYENMMYDGRA